MVQNEAHAAMMLDVMFSWRGAVTLLASACLAMTFRSPLLVCFIGLLFIGLWAWLVRRSGAILKDEANALLDRLMPVKTDGSTTVFTDYFERFRVSFILCIAVYIRILIVAVRLSYEARKVDQRAGLPLSAEFSTLDLMASAGITPWSPQFILIVFFLLNTLTSLIRQVFIVETHDGIRRLSVIVAGVFFVYGFFQSGALYDSPLFGALSMTLGLAALLAGKWVIAGFTQKELPTSAAAKDRNDE